MKLIKDAIFTVLAEDHPQTVRQVFYQLTSAGVIDKTEAEYKNTVTRLLGEMRRERTIPYGWLADSTRWMRRPTTFSSVEDALKRTAALYRRALWDDSQVQVEIWLEKEALAGVLDPISDQWDVPLMVTRGYPSMSFTHSAAEAIAGRHDRRGQKTRIYYFGDHDPSGRDIDRSIINNVGESLNSIYWPGELADPVAAFYSFATFERLAVTEDLIVDLQLPTRPTKKTDSRSKNFTGESVEVDAIPAAKLRAMAAAAIEQHVDHHRLGVLETVEEEERRGLEQIAGLGE